jgi:hypothetical protein
MLVAIAAGHGKIAMVPRDDVAAVLDALLEIERAARPVL